MFPVSDGSTGAQIALGDKRLYAAPSYKEQDAAQPGIQNPDVELAPNAGRKGGALRFKKKNTKAVFFRADRNVAFDAANWSGTISFWLNLDPDQDLEPGFCDPIQVTDKAFNFASCCAASRAATLRLKRASSLSCWG